jgi:hypothetical protein
MSQGSGRAILPKYTGTQTWHHPETVDTLLNIRRTASVSLEDEKSFTSKQVLRPWYTAPHRRPHFRVTSEVAGRVRDMLTSGYSYNARR